MERTKRIGWLDIAKGVGIVLVVLGHAPRDEMRAAHSTIQFLYSLIYTFHMPLYFAISGYLFVLSMETPGIHGGFTRAHYILQRFKKLMLPWIGYSLFLYMVMVCVNMLPGLGDALVGSSFGRIGFKEYLYLCLWQKNPYGEHLWYIYVLFLIQTLVYLFRVCTAGRIGERTFYIVAWLAALMCSLFIWPDAYIPERIKSQAF